MLVFVLVLVLCEVEWGWVGSVRTTRPVEPTTAVDVILRIV